GRMERMETASSQMVNKGAYQIQDSFKVGKYNLISYRLNDSDSGDLSKVVVDGFDLNCTQVAIRNTTLTFTTDFIDFLYSMTIKCTSFSTPCRSVLRMLKKTQQLQVAVCDRSIELLLETIKSTQYINNSPAFSKLAAHDQTQLLQFLTFQEKELVKSNINLSVFDLTISPRSVKVVNNGKSSTHCYFQFETKRSAKVSIESHIVELLVESRAENHVGVSLSFAMTFMNLLFKQSLKRPKANAVVLQVLRGLNALQIKTVNAVLGYTSSFKIPIANAPKLTKLINLLHEHDLTSPEFKNVDELSIYTRNLNWIHKHKIHLINSITQQDCFYSILLANHLKQIPLRHCQYLATKIESNKFSLMEQHTVPAQLDHVLANVDLGGLSCSEILTEKELFLLGVQQKHCVGGYFRHIQKGSIILKLQGKGNRPNDVSTVYLFWQTKDNSLVIKEHKTYRNLHPKDCHRIAAQQIVNYVASRIVEIEQKENDAMFNDAMNSIPIEVYEQLETPDNEPNYYIEENVIAA
ncbi:hypothetical protein, partial [Vibrio splendidus]|uniref:hypothetical protein n=1 Tax=Vibrio splendidus TaxID=29497 RepID=UPI003D0F9ECF